MVIFLGNTNSGDQNFLNPFIYHRDTSHYMVLKKICVNPSGPFAPILNNVPVKVIENRRLDLVRPCLDRLFRRLQFR